MAVTADSMDSEDPRGVYLLIFMGTLMDVPMPFYQLVYTSLLATAVCSLPEGVLGGPPYNLRMESHNFRHILSWQAENDPAVPASYNVLYRHQRNWNWTTARQCSGTAQLSCDLTEEFQDRLAEYCALVQSVTGTKVFSSPLLRFVPLTQTFLGPPEVNITPCLNCINVTIKLPTSHFREKGKLLSLIDIYGELDYEITLKSQRDGENKRAPEKTTKEVFSTVIEELYPNRNYCVSAVVTASLNKHSIPSAWKCVPSDMEARPGYQVAAVAGAVFVSLIIAGALMCMRAGGYFLRNKSLPHALKFIRRLVYSPWILESEEVACVEVVLREAKEQPRGGSGSDSEDSEDGDSSALWNQDYTRREVLGRGPPAPATPPGQYSAPSANCPGEDSGSSAGATPAPAPQGSQGHGPRPGGDTDTGAELLSPFSEGSCNYPGRQSSSACFTINLHTVLLGTLEGSGDTPAAALPSQEDEGDWQCAHALEAKDDTGTVHKAPGGGDFQEWQNSSPSEESDSSESDTDQTTGYMRR